MPGPPKQSNARKRATGSTKVHAGEDIAPPLLVAVPDPPDCLGGKGSEEWVRVCALLIKEEMLTEWDLPTIKIMCLEFDRYCIALDHITENGEYFVTATGYEQIRPSSAVRDKAFKNYSLLLQRFGGDVVSRSRMKRIKPIEEKKNKFSMI